MSAAVGGRTGRPFHHLRAAARRWAFGAGAVALAGLCWATPSRADPAPGLDYFKHGQFSEAFQSWRQAADGGDPVSALYLGVLYDTGTGVAQDYAQALAWYERAGNEGNATAMFNAAVMHDAGRGAAADPAAAAVWYGRAAERGFGRAEYNLALLYEAGAGVEPSRARAIRLYRDAARHGITAARFHLSALGSPFAGAAMPRPAEDAAMVNFQQAQRLLLTRGTGDAERAVQLFRTAAREGNPLAAYNLAYCYEHGLGVAKNIEQAISWYRRAAATAGDTPIREISEAGARNLLPEVSHAQR